MDCSAPGSSIHGIFQARVLQWGAIAFSQKALAESMKQKYSFVLFFFLKLSCFSYIQMMLAIWSLVPLSFLNPAWITGSSQFMYCWSLTGRILRITLLACEMCNCMVVWTFFDIDFLGLEWKLTAGVQPRLIQGIRSGDGVGEDQDTIASIRY